MMWTWPWYVKQAPTKTSIGTGDGGLCERCITPAMIFLNGRLLCWDHYCEETRTAHTQTPKANPFQYAGFWYWVDEKDRSHGPYHTQMAALRGLLKYLCPSWYAVMWDEAKRMWHDTRA